MDHLGHLLKRMDLVKLKSFQDIAGTFLKISFMFLNFNPIIFNCKFQSFDLAEIPLMEVHHLAMAALFSETATVIEMLSLIGKEIIEKEIVSERETGTEAKKEIGNMIGNENAIHIEMTVIEAMVTAGTEVEVKIRIGIALGRKIDTGNENTKTTTVQETGELLCCIILISSILLIVILIYFCSLCFSRHRSSSYR